MWVGSISSAPAAALGLPLRNGSTRTRASPSERSKHEWPRKRISTSISLGVVLHVKLTGELPADRHADEHAHPRLLGQQGLDALRPQGLVGLGDRTAHLRAVGVAKPAALLQRVRQHALEL